jgi:hypothetical protein
MIISAMLKHTIGQSNGLNLKSEMFKDGITMGRGFLGIDTDYTTDPVNGDIVMEIYSPFYVDPDVLGLQYDLNNSGRFVNTYKWEDREKLQAIYPDAELGGYENPGLLQRTADNVKKMVSRAKAIMTGDTITPDLDMEESEMLDADIYEQLKNRRLPVRRSWIKTWEKVVYWVDREQKKVMRLMDNSNIAKARQSVKYLPERFAIYESVLPILHKVVAVGDTQLEYKKDPFKFLNGFGYSFNREGRPLIFDTPALFPVVPYYAYFENGEVFGKIDNLIGPQKEENKRRTQFLRLLNSMAAAGWMWENGSLSDDMRKKLENFGTRPNLSIEYNQGRQPPSKIQPVDSAGAGFLNAAMTSKQDMSEIANVNRESLARNTQGQSGVAIDLKQTADQTGNEIVFNNLSYSSVIFGNLIMQVLRCGGFYSFEEIESLIDEEDLFSGPVLTEAVKRTGQPPQQPPPPNQQAMQLAAERFGDKGKMLNTAVSIEFEKAMAKFQQADAQYKEQLKENGKQVIMDAVNDVKVGRYGLKVIESPVSPTLRAQNFEQMVALDRMRPGQMPFDEIVEASDIPNKERIIEKMRSAAPPAGLPANLNAGAIAGPVR